MLTIGASHRTTPIAALGTMSAAAHHIERRLREGGTHGIGLAVEELAVLATCGRVEVYAVPTAGEGPAVAALLAREVFGSAPPRVGAAAPHTGGTAGAEGRASAPYLLEGDQVVRHLCRIAAGLDSMVPGEHEIAGQVARAFANVVRPSGHGSALAAAAASARRAGRRVRAETSLGRRAASVGSAAVELARERLHWHDEGADTSISRRTRSAVVIGTGPAGVTIGRALRGARVDRLTFASRAPDRGHDALRAIGADVEALERLAPLMRDADVVFAARGSEGFLIDEEMARGAARARADRRLLIVDLAVPADVDPAVAGVAGVELLGLDDVRERVSRHVALRRKDLAPAEAIVAEVVAEHHRSGHGAEAMITELRRAIEETRAREVSQWLAARNGAGAPTPEDLDRFTRSLVNKLLHDPMVRLRAATPESEAGRALLQAAAELFGLPPGAGPPASGSPG